MIASQIQRFKRCQTANCKPCLPGATRGSLREGWHDDLFLRALATPLDCSPFDARPSRRASDWVLDICMSCMDSWIFSTGIYGTQFTHPLYLNRFRGKPAISELDWPFTPNVESSESFATDTSSALQLAGLLYISSIGIGSNRH